MKSNEALEMMYLHVINTRYNNLRKRGNNFEQCYSIVKKDLEMLEILKKHLSIETEKYYSKSECVLVNEHIYFEELKNETDDYKKIKEWLENNITLEKQERKLLKEWLENEE